MADANVPGENRIATDENEPFMSKPTEAGKSSGRWITAAFGLMFVGIAIAIVYTSASDQSMGAFATAALVGWLGVDALVSAARNRRSLLSRIGPLP
jgi:threonine/homoserine/homoserine lactone efflux protein